MTTVFEPYGARLSCLSARGVSADRPRSMRRAAWTWRSCVVAQREARFSSSRQLGLNCVITATGRQHGFVSVATTAFKSYGTRAPCISPRGVSADRPRSTSRSMDLAWLCCGRTRGALLAKPPAGARLHQHHGGMAARTFKVRDHRVRLPQRAARALSASWSIGRPPTEHAPRSARLAWLCCGATRGALLAKPPAGARLHYHRDRSAARVGVGHDHRVRTLWCTPLLLIGPWSISRPPAEHAPRSVDLA